MTEVSEREHRQYALMRQRVEDLRQGRCGIGTVISDLEGLVWALQETPEEWRDRFIEAWSVLEIDYALALPRQAHQSPDRAGRRHLLGVGRHRRAAGRAPGRTVGAVLR